MSVDMTSRQYWAERAGMKIIVPWEEPKDGKKTLNELFPDGVFTYPEEWIRPYYGQNPVFGFDEVGWVVYVRTYSRETGGHVMETWTDTTRRVWEGNFNIKFTHGQFDKTATLREACRAFHMAWHLGIIPPGRSLWMSGSEYMKTRLGGGDALNNCFKGDTLVHTDKGVFEIKDLAGQTVNVLSQGNVYRPAEVKSFGVQELMLITFAGGEEVYATPGHEWIVYGKKERLKTVELKPGQKVPLARLALPSSPDLTAVLHGFVYGDGWVNNALDSRGVEVKFFGDKRDFADYVGPLGTLTEVLYKGQKVPMAYGLPREFKCLPESPTREYALGFIMGLIGADGSVRDHIRIHQADKDALERVRRIAMYAGFRCGQVYEDRANSPFTGEYSPCYCFNISTYNVLLEHIVREGQKRTFKKSTRPDQYRGIRALERTSFIEDVYCAVEMETHTFTVGSGLLTSNCWGINAEPMPVTGDGPVLVSTPFRFAIDEAMKGGGVGMSIRRKHVEKIPLVKNTVELLIACHNTHPNVDEVAPDFRDSIPADMVDESTDVYVVEDSRQGWGEALARVIDAHFNGTRRVILDFTSVRPYGKKLTFGGRASGPGPLTKLRKINEIINARYDADMVEFFEVEPYTGKDAREQYLYEAGLMTHCAANVEEHDPWAGKLRPIDCGDITQLVGTVVVAGNIRRTAIILLGDEEDRDFVESKNYAKVGWEPSQWRWASNNSISIGPDTTYEHLRNAVAPDIYYNGEPGYVNLELAKNYGRIIDGLKPGCDEWVSIFNPCGEISLEGGHYDAQANKWYGGEPCNLFEISPLNLYLLGFSYIEAAEIGARFAYRVTFTEYEWEMTRNTIEKNRRIGVAITGVTDWAIVAFNENIVTGLDEDGEPLYCKPYVDTLGLMYHAVELAGRLQALHNGTNPPIKFTTVKPSGSVSLVLGNAPGQHFHWGDWMIRRVTVSVNSPLVDAALAAGYYIEPKILGRNADGTPNYDPKTAVIEFVTKAPTAGHPLFRNAAQVPLWEQAMVQESLAMYWADNAVSATLNFHKAPKGDAEAEAKVLDEIARVLDRAKTRIKSTSLLPYFTGADDEGNPYDQLPYEPITEEEYLRRKAKLKGSIIEFFNGVIRDEELDQSFECQGGNCPIR